MKGRRLVITVIAVLLIAAAPWLITRYINSIPFSTGDRAVVEVRRVVAVTDVPESAYPPSSGRNWFGGVSIPPNREPGDVFILIETNGGRGEIQWSVNSPDTTIFSGASAIFADEGTRHILVRTIADPDPVCSPSARAFTLEARARAQQTETESRSVFQARWQGACKDGRVGIVGAVPFNPAITYSSCIVGGQCRIVKAHQRS